MRKQLLIVVSAVVIVVLGSVVLAKSNDQGSKTDTKVPLKTVQDKRTGFSTELPQAYQARPDTAPAAGQTKALPSKNFERSDPQGFLTIRYESGLATSANLAKRSLPEHIETEIRQFFKLRYQGYKDVSLKRGTLQGKETIEHEYEYTNKDGQNLKVYLIAVPYDNDSAYYIILQASIANYDQVVKDLPQIKNSLQMDGPSEQQ